MNKQPESLRLADAICDYSRRGFESEQAAKSRRNASHAQAAAELRRQHRVNAELLGALRDTAQTLAWLQFGECRGFSDGLLTAREACEKARAAIAAATPPEAGAA